MPSHDHKSPAPSADLAAGERILWSGQPDPLISMASKGGPMLFAIVWLAIVGGSVAAAIEREDTFGTLFALAFMGIGIFLLVAPLVEYRRAQTTTYAITDRRLIITRKNGRSIKSIQLSGINQVERIVKRGRITLRIPTTLVSDGDGGQKVDYTDLHGLQDGDRVFRLLTQRAI